MKDKDLMPEGYKETIKPRKGYIKVPGERDKKEKKLYK